MKHRCDSVGCDSMVDLPGDGPASSGDIYQCDRCLDTNRLETVLTISPNSVLGGVVIPTNEIREELSRRGFDDHHTRADAVLGYITLLEAGTHSVSLACDDAVENACRQRAGE